MSSRDWNKMLYLQIFTENGFCTDRQNIESNFSKKLSNLVIHCPYTMAQRRSRNDWIRPVWNWVSQCQWIHWACAVMRQIAAHCWVGRTSVTRQWDSHMYQSRDTPVCSINGHQPPASLPTSVLVANHQSSQSQLLLLADTSPGLSDHYCPVSWNRVLLSWKFDLNT